MTETETTNLSGKDIKTVVQHIADELGEGEKKPQRQIRQIVERAGIEFAERLLQETKEIEANGGMTIDSGDRKRTPGGVYFYLARRDLPEDDRDAIFHAWRVALRKRNEREAHFDEFSWEERSSIIKTLLASKVGEIAELKVSLTGRLGEIERREYLIITTMEHRIDPDSLPKGVPQPPTDPMQYVVYISAKQWERVEKAVEDDDIIVEGYCTFDKETDQYTIYTTYVTTQKLQRKERKQVKQEGKPTNGRKPGGKPESRGSGGRERPPRSQPQPLLSSQPEPEVSTEFPPIQFDVPDGATAQDKQKLEELHRAATTFRQKIEVLEAKPANQQFGLDMTRKLLKNTERQIEMIEKQYAS